MNSNEENKKRGGKKNNGGWIELVFAKSGELIGECDEWWCVFRSEETRNCFEKWGDFD